MPKLLTVFGATGQQGGALIEYVLRNPDLSKNFVLRGITRDLSKPASISLIEKGVELVQADLDDPGSLDKAVAGSYAVFGVTNFWEKASAEVEIAQGKAIADAAVKTGAVQLIWSSLPNVTELSSGELTAVHHFDSKAEVESYIRTLNIKSMFFLPGCFMQNYFTIMKPQLDPDGTWFISLPCKETTRLPMIDIRDTGKFLSPALLNPDKYNGKRFIAATAFYTAIELLETWKRVTGTKVEFRTWNPPSSSLLSNLNDSTALFDKYSYYGFDGQKDLDWTLQQLTDKPTTWEKFVKDYEPWFENNSVV